MIQNFSQVNGYWTDTQLGQPQMGMPTKVVVAVAHLHLKPTGSWRLNPHLMLLAGGGNDAQAQLCTYLPDLSILSTESDLDLYL